HASTIHLEYHQAGHRGRALGVATSPGSARSISPITFSAVAKSLFLNVFIPGDREKCRLSS
ncbi:hypothetical protein, partial [uncultured Ramlibacter sp.]|uniref:hypothetical protein n=1 Tax=uncultured Ramlibacter sp. TaxID=260755 RepID=UPI002619DC8D